MTYDNSENNTKMPPCYAYEPFDNITESSDEENCCICKNMKVKHDSIVHVRCCIYSKSYHYDETCSPQNFGNNLQMMFLMNWTHECHA